MSLPGIVAAETEPIREAILGAEPTDEVAAVCEGKLNGQAFNYHSGGYVGSDLLNIATALFQHRRLYKRKSPTARPVVLDEVPRSFVGRTITNLLDVLPPDEVPVEAPQFERSRPMAGDHFCSQAEEGYRDSYYERNRRTMVLDRDGKSLFFMKGTGAETLLTQRNTYVNGIKIPPGIICAVDYYPGSRIPTDDSNTWVLPRRALTKIAPLRVSIFGVPCAERRETFLRPEQAAQDYDPLGLDENEDLIMGCETMLTFSWGVAHDLKGLTFDRSTL